MSLRFVVVEDAANSHHDRPLLVLERTHLPALRTGMLLAQLVRLLSGPYLQCARQQRPHRRHRHFLHFRQADVEPGTLLAPVLPHDDFSPAPRQFLDPANIL
jgi:hypothetical protein